MVDYLLDRGWPMFICCVLGQLAIEFADKIITISAVYLIILLRRWQLRRRKALITVIMYRAYTAAITDFRAVKPMT